MGAYQLKNEELTLTVISAGAEMKSLKDNKTEQEYLWQANPKFWGRTSPVLFPIVGNYAQKQSVYEGKTYTLSQHGFARDMEFDLESQTEEEIWFVLKDTESTLEKYPFHFILKVGYRLSGRQVEVMWKVENPNDKKMYFSIGGHPAFMIPEQYDIVFNKDLRNHGETALEYVLIDPETAGVDAAHPRKLSLINGKIPYTRTLFDEDALIFDNTQVERVGVEVDGKPYVTLTCKGFPSVGVWSKPKADAPFVCLEPWIGRCDNVGFDGELKDKYGEQHLKAGESFQASYTIAIGE